MRLAANVAVGVLAVAAAGCATTAPPAVTPNLIIVRQTAKTPDQVVESIKAFAELKKWVYMGATKVKPPQGEVTMVKVCIPALGAVIWPLGLQMSAMLPCGNFGVYQKADRTEISMLDARYMQILVPHPEVVRASAIAKPLLDEMLEAVAK